jgi:hypothetical protein
LFDVRDELIGDRVPIGPEVGRIDGIGIVEVGIGVLDGDEDHPGEAGARPVLIELVAVFFEIPEVFPPDPGSLGIFRRFAGSGRLFPEPDEGVELAGKMPLVNHQGVVGFRVLLEAGGQEDDGAEEHRAAPKFGQALALDLDMLDVLRVLLFGEGRDDLIEGHVDRPVPRGVDPDLFGDAEEVPGRDVPHLALAAVHGELEGMAVRPAEGLVFMEKGLDDILAGRDLSKAVHGEAEHSGVEYSFLPGHQAFDVDPENGLGILVARADLEPGLPGFVIREH